jgi:hypothetical protein
LALQQTKTKRPFARPEGAMGDLNVPGTRVGAIVSIGLVVLSWLTIPIARPFLVGTAVIGAVVGLILFWSHRHPVNPEDESMVPHRRK